MNRPFVPVQCLTLIRNRFGRRLASVLPFAAVALLAHPPSNASAAQTFPATADAYVKSSDLSGNFGFATRLRADDEPTVRTYIRFDIRGLTAPVARATLKVRPTVSSLTGLALRPTAATGWEEGTIDYANAPTGVSPAIATSGPYGSVEDVSLDVTPLVTGNGPVAVAVTTMSSIAVSLASREYGVDAGPRLVVQTASGTTSPAPAPAAPTQSAPAPATTLFQDDFSSANGVNGLVTNQYAFLNLSGVKSPNWEMTSGSFFSQNGTGWSGAPSAKCSPDIDSIPCTNSGVLRLRTRRSDFGDVSVGVGLRNNRMTNLVSATTSAGEGAHLWLRYQPRGNRISDGTELYKLEVNRRDGAVNIKKKCYDSTKPSVNYGVYYKLAGVYDHPIPFGRWQQVGGSVKNNADGSVTVRLLRDGVELVSATDRGIGCAPHRAPGHVGVRGDDDDFNLDNFVVSG